VGMRRGEGSGANDVRVLEEKDSFRGRLSVLSQGAEFV
jgi:hypothetical protein